MGIQRPANGGNFPARRLFTRTRPGIKRRTPNGRPSSRRTPDCGRSLCNCQLSFFETSSISTAVRRRSRWGGRCLT